MDPALSKPGDPSFLQPTKPDATSCVVVRTFNPSGHRSKQIFVNLKPVWFVEGVSSQSGLHRQILSEINTVRKSQTTNKQQRLFQGWPKRGISFSPWGGHPDSSASSVSWASLGLDRTHDRQRHPRVSPTVCWDWGLGDMW